LHDVSILISVHARLKIILKQVLGILGDARAPPMSNAMMWAKVRIKPEVDETMQTHVSSNTNARQRAAARTHPINAI
jgi:hypothetical protein